MNDLPGHEEYCDSLSCLHSLEHFGLGRYGDKISSTGYIKGFESMSKLIKKNGIFYLSVPIGCEIIQFNSHRIFDINTITQLVNNNFDIVDFSYVDDKGKFFKNQIDVILKNKNLQLKYGCGIFELRKSR